MPIIDLRSDTVTRPSPAMRQAMADAVVGDDVFLEDPTVNQLQDRAAALFGREAALFVPSGSMGNLTCVMAQTRPGQEVVCETNGHIYNYEMGALSALAGRSEEHTSELQSQSNLVCRLLLEKKNNTILQ